MHSGKAVLAKMSPIERLATLVCDGSVPSFHEWRHKLTIMYEWAQDTKPLKKGQTVAVDFDGQTKVSALFFDRVIYNIFDSDPPPEQISYYGGTDLEFFALCFGLLLESDDPTPEKTMNELVDFVMGGEFQTRNRKRIAVTSAARALCYELWAEKGIDATPVYSSGERRDLEYRAGETGTILAAISNLAIVDNDQLSWPQVLQFRRDKEALVKLRRLRNWLDRDMVGKPASFISDAIATKLEDYEWALKKHGIKSITGTISQLLEPKVLGAATAAAGGLTIAGAATLGALAGSGIILGRAAISIAEKLIDLGDLKRGPSADVAFVHHIKVLGK